MRLIEPPFTSTKVPYPQGSSRTLALGAVLGCLLVMGIFALPSQGQIRGPSGFRKFDHTVSGMRFYYPREFKPTPSQPTEKLIVATFKRKKVLLPKKDAPGGRRPAEMYVFLLSPRVTQDSDAPNPNDEAKSYDDVIRKRNEIHYFKEFMKSRFRRYKLVPLPNHKKYKDVKQYQLEDSRSRRSTRSGLLLVREKDGWTYGVVAFCDNVVESKIQAQARIVCKTMYRSDSYRVVKDYSASAYRGKDYRDIEFRIKARREMIKGWKCFDTENFFLVYHTKNMGLIRKVARDLESIRPLYKSIFPPANGEIKAVSVVRVCRDVVEYKRYGGPPGSAGYWNPMAKELVLYDFAYRPPNAGTDFKSRKVADSFIVLYHEALHQYVYYAAGEVTPHYWFNEGMGDYFSGTTIYSGSSRIKGVGLNRWRIHYAKMLNESKRFIPLEKLLWAERATFYGRQRGAMYALAWSFCYFIMQTEETNAKPEWRQIIDKYYTRLQESTKRRVGILGENATLSQKTVAQGLARKEALKFALTQIDLPELETAWRAWLKKVKDPWAKSRPKPKKK